MKHYLEVDSIILEFNTKRVLQDVYLKNETGKTTGILGRNGTGKTCLMKIIYGGLKINNKSIRFDGKPVINSYRNPKFLKYLPQNNFIPQNLKIKRIFRDFNLNFSGFTKYFPEFSKYFDFKLKNLSGGEKRIIEIYIILASETKFCMLDEPFSHIMPLHVSTIKNIINDEKKNKGIIITDQLYEHIIDICDEIYLLSFGKTYLIKDKNDLIKLGYLNKSLLRTM